MADPKVHTKMEFAVQMTCQSCEESIKTALNVPGIDNVFVDISNELVLVDTSLPSSTVQNLLESTGKLVVFRGFGSMRSDTTASHHGAAVAIMKGRGYTSGLARLVQVSSDLCMIEGTVDGLTPGEDHHIKIHEFGDISQGCESCGEVYGRTNKMGDLGIIKADSTGRATFQLTSEQIKVWDIIGRSILIHTNSQVLSSRLLCGIIARSAGLFQNTKKVCTCDGVTIWDEARKKTHL